MLNCPICKGIIIENLNYIFVDNLDDKESILYSSDIYWLYNGNYGKGKWCYDKMTNEMIEYMYQEYLKRTRVNSKKDNIDEYKIIPVISPSLLEDRNKSYPIKYNTIELCNIYENNADGVDLVDYGFYDDKSMKNQTNIPIPYILTIGSEEYIINFDKMLQICKKNYEKCRTITRIDINCNSINKHKVLKNNYNVKGVYGFKYSGL